MDDSFGRLTAEILDALPEMVVRFRIADLTIVYCNLAWSENYGLTPTEVLGTSLDEYLSADGRRGLELQLRRLGPDDPILTDRAARTDLNQPDRLIQWVDRYLPSGEIIAIGRDVTELRRVEHELVESEARFRALADGSNDIMWRLLLEPEPHFDYLSPSMEKLTGRPPSYFIEDFGRFLDTLDDDGRALLERAWRGEPIPDRVDIRGWRADGSEVVAEVHLSTIPGGFQGAGSDVTELRRLHAELTALALYDPLTELANRRLLGELMEAALARCERRSTPIAVLFIDLDGFKQVNDLHGHDAGDAVLRATAERLSAVARSADIVARVGGDEFVVVEESDGTGDDDLPARLVRALALPIAVTPSLTVTCPASVGRADSIACGYDATALLTAADAAMYEMKRARHPSADVN